jgi:hypothetical protein
MNLKALKEAAEQACREAFEQRQYIDGAVNWGDLHCCGALKIEDEEGNVYYAVEIEEADPMNPTFAEFIGEHLVEKGFVGIRVNTEW